MRGKIALAIKYASTHQRIKCFLFGNPLPNLRLGKFNKVLYIFFVHIKKMLAANINNFQWGGFKYATALYNMATVVHWRQGFWVSKLVLLYVENPFSSACTIKALKN